PPRRGNASFGCAALPFGNSPLVQLHFLKCTCPYEIVVCNDVFETLSISYQNLLFLNLIYPKEHNKTL
ncbi:hypothetical protein, partial [Paenibacillus ehimensis]